MVEEKITISEEEIKVLRELSFEDIVKMQIVSCLKVANSEPEKLPVAVGMLERLFRDELPEEYWRKIEEITDENNGIAEKLYPMWRVDETQRLQREIFIAMEKFALLVGYVKSKIPQDLIANL